MILAPIKTPRMDALIMEQEDQLQDALAVEQKHVLEVTFFGPAKNASMNQQKRVMGEVSSLRLVFYGGVVIDGGFGRNRNVRMSKNTWRKI